VVTREIAVKKYVVRLSAEEREQLTVMVHAGRHPARQLTRARILLKADVSEAGDGWSDSQIAAALDTSVDTAGHQRRHRRADPAAVGGGRFCLRSGPEAFAEFGQKADL